MALEPITRQEKIIAGQDLTPITRMEKFLKQYGGGSGGVTSWNDLTDKPFGDNADGTVYPMSGKYVEGMGWSETVEESITWDGNTSGKESAIGGLFYKVSDKVFTAEQLVGQTMTMVTAGGETITVTLDESVVRTLDSNGEIQVNIDGEVFIQSVPVASKNFTTGLWFSCEEDIGAYVSGLFVTVETIHPIDQKFLPSAFVVNFATTDMQNWTADKTADEIAAAVNAGKEVYGSAMGMKVDLIGVAPNGYVTFGRIFPDAANLMSYHFGVTTDNSVQATMSSLQMTPIG